MVQKLISEDAYEEHAKKDRYKEEGGWRKWSPDDAVSESNRMVKNDRYKCWKSPTIIAKGKIYFGGVVDKEREEDEEVGQKPAAVNMVVLTNWRENGDFDDETTKAIEACAMCGVWERDKRGTMVQNPPLQFVFTPWKHMTGMLYDNETPKN